MKVFNHIISVLALVLMTLFFSGCDYRQNSDQVQQERQEQILKDGVMAVGLPSVKNHREMRLLKDIIEMRDQEGLVTYTYIVAENTGKLIFLGESIGYGIPASTQYTNPQKVDHTLGGTVYTIAQADPNGLFSPSSSEGTWVILKDPNSGNTKPVYIETRIIVSPFKLNSNTQN